MLTVKTPTIRCKHGKEITSLQANDEYVELEFGSILRREDRPSIVSCGCSVIIPTTLYHDIHEGANLTHVFFKDGNELIEYLQMYTKKFQVTSHTSKSVVFPKDFNKSLVHLIF